MTNLKRIIDEKGVQQRWLAEQVGVTEVSMSRYVSGDRIPKAPLAIRMADVLGVDVKELYGWDDKHVVGEPEQPETHEKRTETHACDCISRSAQPDLSGYSDRLWHNAYERGKAEAQQRWIPCSERLPENKSYVLTTIYIPGRQPHARSGWFEDGLFMNDNGDTWKSTDREVCAWMPLPEVYREGE